MSLMDDKKINQVFAVLPDAQELYFTEDGKFHVHPGIKGSKKVLRPDQAEEVKDAEPKK